MSYTTHVDKENEEQAGCADPPQYITALNSRAPHSTRLGASHVEILDFHWPEAVCVFLDAQATFLPARRKPNHALLPWTHAASLVAYESKCAVFQ